MEEWKEYKLGDVSSVSSSKRIFADEYQSEGIPFYRSKEIIEKQKGISIANELYIKESRYNEIKNKFGVPQKGDILLTSVGTLGIPYLVKDEIFYFKDGNITWFYNFKGINNRYLYYWFLSPIAKHYFDIKAIGSTQKALTIETLKKFDIVLPSKSIQQKVADVLKSLDDKIELNNRINANLEEQAQALFRRWFVDFEFPNEQGLPYKSNGGKFVDSELGKIPEGWKIGTLSEIADYLNGLAMQKFRPKDKELGIPVLKIKELGQKSCDSSSDICSESIKPEYIVNDGDVIFSWSGTLKIDIWCGGICGLNQHLFKVTSKIYPKWFYYYWTKQYLNKFIRIAKDKAVTMGHIKREDLDKSQLSIPNNKNFRTMNNIIGPLLEKQITLNIENRFLIQLRDAFLPKLMNNEIKI